MGETTATKSNNFGIFDRFNFLFGKVDKNKLPEKPNWNDWKNHPGLISGDYGYDFQTIGQFLHEADETNPQDKRLFLQHLEAIQTIQDKSKNEIIKISFAQQLFQNLVNQQENIEFDKSDEDENQNDEVVKLNENIINQLKNIIQTKEGLDLFIRTCPKFIRAMYETNIEIEEQQESDDSVSEKKKNVKRYTELAKTNRAFAIELFNNNFLISRNSEIQREVLDELYQSYTNDLEVASLARSRLKIVTRIENEPLNVEEGINFLQECQGLSHFFSPNNDLELLKRNVEYLRKNPTDLASKVIKDDIAVILSLANQEPYKNHANYVLEVLRFFQNHAPKTLKELMQEIGKEEVNNPVVGNTQDAIGREILRTHLFNAGQQSSVINEETLSFLMKHPELIKALTENQGNLNLSPNITKLFALSKTGVDRAINLSSKTSFISALTTFAKENRWFAIKLFEKNSIISNKIDVQENTLSDIYNSHRNDLEIANLARSQFKNRKTAIDFYQKLSGLEHFFSQNIENELLKRNANYLKNHPSYFASDITKNDMAVIFSLADQYPSRLNYVLEHLRIFQQYASDELKKLFQEIANDEINNEVDGLTRKAKGKAILRSHLFYAAQKNKYINEITLSFLVRHPELIRALTEKEDESKHEEQNTLLLEEEESENEEEDNKQEKLDLSSNIEKLLLLSSDPAKRADYTVMLSRQKIKITPKETNQKQSIPVLSTATLTRMVTAVSQSLPSKKAFKSFWYRLKEKKTEILNYIRTKLNDQATSEKAKAKDELTLNQQNDVRLLNDVFINSDLKGELNNVIRKETLDLNKKEEERYKDIESIISKLIQGNFDLPAIKAIVADSHLKSVIKGRYEKNTGSDNNQLLKKSNPYIYTMLEGHDSLEDLLLKNDGSLQLAFIGSLLEEFIENDKDLQTNLLQKATQEQLLRLIRDYQNAILKPLVENGYLHKAFPGYFNLENKDFYINLLDSIYELDIDKELKEYIVHFFRARIPQKNQADFIADVLYKPYYEEFFSDKKNAQDWLVSPEGEVIHLKRTDSLDNYFSSISNSLPKKTITSRIYGDKEKIKDKNQLALALLKALNCCVTDSTQDHEIFPLLNHKINGKEVRDYINKFLKIIVKKIEAGRKNYEVIFDIKQNIEALLKNEKLRKNIELSASQLLVLCKYFEMDPACFKIIQNDKDLNERKLDRRITKQSDRKNIDESLAIKNIYFFCQKYPELGSQIEGIVNLILNKSFETKKPGEKEDYEVFGFEHIRNQLSSEHKKNLNQLFLYDIELRNAVIEAYTENDFNAAKEYSSLIPFLIKNQKLTENQLMEIGEDYSEIMVLDLIEQCNKGEFAPSREYEKFIMGYVRKSSDEIKFLLRNSDQGKDLSNRHQNPKSPVRKSLSRSTLFLPGDVTIQGLEPELVKRIRDNLKEPEKFETVKKIIEQASQSLQENLQSIKSYLNQPDLIITLIAKAISDDQQEERKTYDFN